MVWNYLLLRLIGILACFSVSIVARETIIGASPVNSETSRTFRYQVSVQIRGEDHVCGGGIIGERFILTAAHCVLNRNRHLRSTHISVLAGTTYLNETGPPAVIINVERVFFPKEFHPMAAYNHGDIAVLRLVDSLQLEAHPNLRKLDLPHSYHLRELAKIAGFGCDRYYSTGDESVAITDGRLRSTVVSIFSDDECEQRYPHGAFELGRHLCAEIFDTREDTVFCTGDSGSPLIHNNVVIGILSSFSSPLVDQREPDLYVRVVHYADMIWSVIEYGRAPNTMSLNV